MIEDIEAFAAEIREAVHDCRLAEIVAERLQKSKDEIKISLPMEVALRDPDEEI